MNEKYLNLIYYYISKGYISNEKDWEALHMSFSPFKVPDNLTKIQIRRRINKYLKEGNKQTIKDLLGNRLEILINGRQILGLSFKGEVPKDSFELHKLLENIVDDFKGIDQPDVEVLGKYSPRFEN